MCVLIFFTNFVWNNSQSEKNSSRYCLKCTEMFKVKYPVWLSYLMKLEISQQIFEQRNQVWNFIKIRRVEAEMFHADRQADVTNLTVIFRYFANALKMI